MNWQSSVATKPQKSGLYLVAILYGCARVLQYNKEKDSWKCNQEGNLILVNPYYYQLIEEFDE